MKIKISYFSTLLVVFLIASCSVTKHEQKLRKSLGMDLPFCYIKSDTIPASKPYYIKVDGTSSDSIKSIIGVYETKVQLFLGQTEVTNKQYKVFLQSLLNDSLVDKYDLCKIHNGAWLRSDSLNPFYDSLSKVYHVSEYYDDYPVVCISYEAMQEYVKWLNKNEPAKDVFYKIPSYEEWKYGFNMLSATDSSYAWETDSYLNGSGRALGNFALLDAEQVRYDHVTDKMRFDKLEEVGYLSSIKGPLSNFSYNPNSWGIYHMSGNVAEIVEMPFKAEKNIYWTKGGSWHSPPYYGRKHAFERYVLPSPYVGFRILKYRFIDNGQ